MSTKVSDLTPLFIDSKFQKEIDEYVKENIKECLKKDYADFVPLVTERIQNICNDWTKRLKEVATNGDFYCKIFTPSLDKNAFELIHQQFVTKMHLMSTNTNANYKIGDNAMLKNVLRDGQVFEFTCWWTPKHPYLSQQNSIKKLYQPQSNSNSLYHYEMAKNGKGTNLFTLKSADGATIFIHDIYFSRFDYFKKMFETGFKESDTKIIPSIYTSKSLENARQFIYLGDIDSISRNDLTQLLELLSLAHEWQAQDLYNHCIDLIHEFLIKNDSLSNEQVLCILKIALTYDLKDFLKPCLMAAENLEMSFQSKEEKADGSEIKLVDWDEIKPEYYADFLEIAVQNSLECTKKKLNEAIKQSLTK